MIRNSSLKNRDGFILVYDLSWYESFSNLERFINIIEDKKKGGSYELFYKIPILLVGNKSDL